jgi:DNA replication protein DnaC
MKKETRTEDIVCQVCGETFTGEVSIYRLFNRAREIRPRECPRCRDAREAEEQRLAEEELRLQQVKTRLGWRRSCGIPEYLQEKTFDSFDRSLQRQVFDAVKTWADGFSIDAAWGYPSLVLWSGGYGQGKTHLAVAACNSIIESWDGDPERAPCPIRFESGPGLVRRVRATYNIPPDNPYHETEEMVYQQLRGVRLLVLDDVGKEKPSAHTREVYFYVVDERLKMGLPVLITSNLPLNGPDSLEELMGSATVSRIVGMCQGSCLELKGDDFRMRKKKP